ncbi:MAG: Maf family protein [Bacteroidota bacterium]
MDLEKKLILASRSPRRIALLRQLGIPFESRASNVEEIIDPSSTPEENARRLAFQKAEDVAQNVKKGFVVGVDTIVVLNGAIFGKPATADEARLMLKMLSGNEHRVCTAFAIIDRPSDKQVVEHEVTRVIFRKIDESEIDEYVATGSPMDKAGAYGIQDDYGAVFVERVEGCFYNVVGFPLTKFIVTLKRFQSSRS